MKITIDTKKNTLTVNGKKPDSNNDAIHTLKQFIRKNTQIDEYEEDSMWMSYRYCIGRHTIASHMRANDIARMCYKRMDDDRSVFTAFDINRKIESCMSFGFGVQWYFPITYMNSIYTTAIDIYCQFIHDYGIKSKDDLLKYKKIRVMLSDNERGYKLEILTWEEYLRPIVHKIVCDWFSGQPITEDCAWEFYTRWKDNNMKEPYFHDKFTEISKNIPSRESFSISSIEDLFVWNHLAHLFDVEHHHVSTLPNGETVEWYYTYIRDLGIRDNELAYTRVRVPVGSSINNITILDIPDSE